MRHKINYGKFLNASYNNLTKKQLPDGLGCASQIGPMSENFWQKAIALRSNLSRCDRISATIGGKTVSDESRSFKELNHPILNLKGERISFHMNSSIENGGRSPDQFLRLTA